MADAASGSEPFHLLLEGDEVRPAITALNLLISEERPLRALAREVLVGLEGSPDERGTLSLVLSPQQMKVTHTAVKLHFDDLQRDQADEREVLRRILDKLPDEDTMRAIELD